ncbi:flagellin modification protein A [Campylobacter sp. MIT 99-7217]|uniref:flagellin modification protein PtmA n=1 Tax=Campylobacter sp. MIT 99-7217 TaxID=535091 RepID=UPI0011585232|nr:oxidoreductase [Campylobacter sp. MIT 99-7217]TQR33813.1 flagellin modification protein A [Campylobacter sp. MIT 99-7217]
MHALLENKLIVVAGACGRIGKALCKKILASAGEVVLADINEEKMKEFAKELETEFKKEVFFVKMDICSRRNLQENIEKIALKFKKIDAFVNSSYPFGKDWGKVPYYELEYEQICESLNLHLGGFMLAAQEFVRFFKKQGYGNIINLSSIMGVYAPKFENYAGTSMQSSLEYSVIKAGINHLGVWLAKELFNTNIRVNTLVSGGILDNQPEIFLQAYRKCCASKGMLEAHDVCGALVFLLSDESKFITGQSLVVADGWGL